MAEGIVASVKSLSKGDHATAGIYVLLIGMALSDIIPTPGDAIFFSRQRKLRDQYFAKEITPKMYWEKSTLNYYLINFLWWMILLAVVVVVPGSSSKKFKILLALIGGGAVIGVVYKNIKKDEAAQALAAEALIPKQ